jgi:hypothetical protein
MTLPDKRYRAVVQTKKFLIDLCSPKRTPRVPKDIRQLANSLLRHYPSDWDMTIASQQAPDLFAERMEPVTRLFKQYEEGKKNEA